MSYTESISFSMMKESVLEGMTVAAASLEDAASHVQDSITNESIRRGEMMMETYEVVSDAFSGGMGSVWRVRHTGWDAELAMKRPHPRFFAEASSERKATFIAECENWINLGLHPNIVSCYYVREVGGVPTVFSEWMDGGSLKDRIADGSLYEGSEDEVQERILDIAMQAARGLAYSHANGLVHQDVKPGNLLLSSGWDAKVADFGLAQAISNAAADVDARSTGYTLAYCPAEQAEGAEPAPWMDVYSWAITVLEMYAGGRTWESGAEVAENVPRFFPECRVPIPMDMQVLLVQSIVEHPNGFDGIMGELEMVYRAIVGEVYPRPAAQMATDTAAFLNNRALSFLDLGKPDQARELWGLALVHDSNSTLVKHNRGVAELYDQALDESDSYRLSAKLENVFISVVESADRSKSGTDLMLSARMALSMYSPYAEQAAQRALEVFPSGAPERRACEELIDIVRTSCLQLPIDPSWSGPVVFDRQGSRCYFAWIEYPKNGGDWSWMNLAVCDLSDKTKWKQRRAEELEGDDAPYFGYPHRAIFRDGLIVLVDPSGRCARFDSESLELVDVLDELPFDDPLNDGWPYFRLSDELRSIEPMEIIDQSSLWGRGSSKSHSGFAISSGRGSVRENGFDAEFPAMALTMGLYALCADHERRFLLVYQHHPFSSAPPFFQILDTELFGKAPEFAVARVSSYRETIDAEAARQQALAGARAAFAADDYSEALRHLDEAYRLSPDEPGDEWVRLNSSVGVHCVRDSLRGVRVGGSFSAGRISDSRDLGTPPRVIGPDDPMLSTRVLGSREPCDTRGEEKWSLVHRVAFEGDEDAGKTVSVDGADDVHHLPEGFRGDGGALYDQGSKIMYTCGSGEFCAWDASMETLEKMASVRFGRDIGSDEASFTDLPLFDPEKPDALWALAPYRMFLNKERNAMVAFVRSKILNPCSVEGAGGLEMMTVIDLRTMDVVHNEACHPDHWVFFEGTGETARVLTLVGINADGSLIAFSHDEQWTGDGELELWDVEEPRSFTKFLIPVAASSQVGLRGDGNALTCWSGSHKSGDEWFDDFEEHLLDWKFRLPDDPNWDPQKQKLIWDKRAKREKEKKRLEEQRRKEEQRRLEQERREEERRRQEEEQRRQEEERRREEELVQEQFDVQRLEVDQAFQALNEIREQYESMQSKIDEKKSELNNLGFFKGKEKRRLMAEIDQLEGLMAPVKEKYFEASSRFDELSLKMNR